MPLKKAMLQHGWLLKKNQGRLDLIDLQIWLLETFLIYFIVTLD